MEQKRKKHSFWKILLIVIVLLIAAIMVVLPFALDRAKEAAKSRASILSGTAETGSLVKTLSGAGTITDEDKVEVTVPDGVEIKEYLVEEGQYVTEGTGLAVVDKTSVLQLISTLQKNLDYVQQQMVDVSDTASTGKITAKTGGKVMKIYAEAGDNVRDVMDRYGCLAVLSIDGYFAADITTDAVRPGDTVSVEFEDGKTADGKVENRFNGVATIVVSDNFGAPDQTVMVSDSEGKAVGKGTLYIHKEWRALGYSGTIKAVSAKEGRKLGTGGTLFTLKNTDANAEYNLLAAEHRDYEEVIARLFTLYKDGTVKAENDGCAIGIDDTLVENVAFEGQDYEIEYLAYCEANHSAMKVVSLDDTDAREEIPQEDPGPIPKNVYIQYFVVLDSENKQVLFGTGTQDPISYDEFVQNQQIIISVPAGISWEEMPVDFPEGFPGGPKGAIYCLITYTYDEGDEGEIEPRTEIYYVGEQQQNMVKPAQTILANINGQQVEFVKYEINPIKLMDVVPQEKVSVTITVDELDILSVSVGQEATVTVDALPGRSFKGEVVEIDSSGSNSGGNTKFTAKILLDRQAYMIAGMNASCTIVTDVCENVLLVPTEALVDEGNRTVIYTGVDEDGETLINPVVVETGVSDGLKTQILSGLVEGQEFRYAYYDTLAIADQLAQLMPGRPPEGFPERGN